MTNPARRWWTGSTRRATALRPAPSCRTNATRSPRNCAAGVRTPAIDVVISTGGTGLTGRDVTVEAHRDVYEKEIEAFATVFTIVSMNKIGTSAVQSRATGGVANGTYLFALPGSPGACKDAWDEILSLQLDYRHRPCNFVEIFPRLDEHKRRK